MMLLYTVMHDKRNALFHRQKNNKLLVEPCAQSPSNLREFLLSEQGAYYHKEI